MDSKNNALFSKKNLTSSTIEIKPHTNKWSTVQHQTFLSSPVEHHNILSKHQIHGDDFNVKHAEKFKKIKRELFIIRDDPVEELLMIDAIQQLGIDYHFEDVINEVLQRHYIACFGHEIQEPNLFEVSLRFRLLRQYCYAVSTDVFDIFKDKEGKFNHSLSKDIQGLMSLYEASQLSMEGENDTLDEAKDFANRLITTWLNDNQDHHEATVVKNKLRYTHHNYLARFTTNDFNVNLPNTNYPWRHVLQDLARMNFNMLRSMHQKEMQQVSKWWNELGLNKEMKLIRDQPLKWYMWSMVITNDPNLSQLRIDVTKPISLIYVIDDIFDIYGTIDELTLFTEAVNRWDFTIVERLPTYMQECFKALDGVTSEIAAKIIGGHRWNSVDSLRKTWAVLCNAFLVEAKWFASKQIPKAEEYLKNGVVSSGVHVVLIHMFFMLGQGLTKESVDLILDDNDSIVWSIATILRLWDDLGSAKNENQDEKDGSYVECYMKENEGSSVEIAQEHVHKIISDTWKRLNKESLSPNHFSSAFIKGSLNLARMIPLMYSYDNNSSLHGLEGYIKSLM